ncbi:MAG: M23 family metallopeptidase [bacterium]|nr:M23 family metallopeptidase [bacterium]
MTESLICPCQKTHIATQLKDSGTDSQTAHGRAYRTTRTVGVAVSLISLVLAVGTLLPSTAKAGIISDFWASLISFGTKQADASIVDAENVQTMTLLQPAVNIDPNAARGGGDITIVDGSALMPEEGPSGTVADIEKSKNATISVYVVREEDTLTGIAKLFRVSPSTILWANDLPRNAVLKIGQTLIILPVTGVRYTVESGDTLVSIAKKFGADAADIANFNGIDDDMIVVGMKLIIPDGEIAVAAVVAAPASSAPSSAPFRSGAIAGSRNGGPSGTVAEITYYIRPIVGGTRTQGIHGYNGVDLAAPKGTPILASATGDVIVAKGSGWNGGYGNYIVIQHGNGSQTLYSHASKVIVYAGEHVVQGQVIGYVGATGKATGPHVHFEIRNGIRNPF